MVTSMDEVLAFAETIVIGNGAPEFKEVLGKLTPSQCVVDLVRITSATSDYAEGGSKGQYDGICW